MKKKLAVLLAASLAVLMVMTGCGSNGDAEKDNGGDKQQETEKKTFTVGFDAEYPPYGYMDENGEYTGFDLELAEAVCEMEGWELVKKPIDWNSKDMELNAKYIDCIWNGFTMNGREDDYTFSLRGQYTGDCCVRGIRYQDTVRSGRQDCRSAGCICCFRAFGG